MVQKNVSGFVIALCVATVAAATACGHQNSPTAPTTASSTPSSLPSSGSVLGATITGTVLGATTTNVGMIRTFSTALTVTVSGSSTSTTVDGSGHFTLLNVPAGHVDLHFTGANVDGHLGLDDVMDRAMITIVVRVSGATVELDNGQRDDPDNKVEIEGLVTATSASTITVNGKMITVDAATTIVHGDTTIAFASIKMGDRVHVKGTPTTTTGGLATVLATKIEVQNTATAPPTTTPPTTAPGGDDDGGTGDGKNDNEAEVTGAIAAKSGTCPKLNFTVNGKAVTTSASTQFKGAACAALVNGTKVEVKGTLTGGVIVASRVQTDN